MYIQYRNERSYHALKPDTQAAQDRARHCSNRNRCSRRWCGGSCSRRAGAGEVPAAVALASAVQVAPALAWARVAAVAGSCSAGSSPKRPTLPARSLHRPSNRCGLSSSWPIQSIVCLAVSSKTHVLLQNHRFEYKIPRF